MLNTLTRNKMLHIFTEYYVKGADLQRVHVIAVRKIKSAEDKRLETQVHFSRSGMDATGRHEVLRGPSVGISHFRAISRELQLWHLHLMVSVQSVCDLPSRVSYIFHFCLL
jgi:hypothetical protein